MENPKRDGAAGRLDMTLPKCWHDRIWNLYRSVVVFGNTPNGPAWFPPSRDGGLQGVLVVQTKEPRVFREHEIRMLAEAASQVAPVVSEARTLDRFIAPAQEKLWELARNVWWTWDPECVSLFRDLNPGAGAS